MLVTPERQPDPILQAAAVVHLFHPAKLARRLGVTPREVLSAVSGKIRTVEREGSVWWTLDLGARQQALESLAQPSAILELARSDPERLKDAEQQSFEAVLAGKAPSLESVDDTDELGRLALVARWLESVPGPLPWPQPEPEDIARRREVVRLGRELEWSTGKKFHGRRRELSWLRRFATTRRKDPVMNLVAEGGMGKSALVAKLLLELHAFSPDSTVPVVWLDFDSATLDVRQPMSVLGEIVRQLDFQYPGYFRTLLEEFSRQEDDDNESLPSKSSHTGGAGRVSDTSWFTDILADTLEHLPDPPRQVLIVLDTFERAQYRGVEFSELAVKMMRELNHSQPSVRILIAGRASIDGVPRERVLGELDKKAAKAFLKAQGVRSPGVAGQIMEIVGRSPLRLKLAARLAKLEKADRKKTESAEWKELLSDAMVEGVLYRRILDHIPDPKVRRLAHPGLVLRRLDADLLQGVVAPAAGVEIEDDEEARELFRELSRTYDLVRTRTDGGLELRPEVRRLVLDLMRRDKERTAEPVHRRAVQWFAKLSMSEARAEELYHLLMLGRLNEAAKRWRDEAGSLLRESEEELPTAARGFLKARLEGDVPDYASLSMSIEGTRGVAAGGFSVEVDEVDEVDESAVRWIDWESTTASKIEKLMNLGKLEEARRLARTREKRTADSPLFLVEARLYRQLEDIDAAADRIDRGLLSARRLGRAREEAELCALQAWVAEGRGQPGEAVAAWREALAAADRAGDAGLALHMALSGLEAEERHPETQPAHAALRSFFDRSDAQDLLANPEVARRAAARFTDRDRLLKVLGLVGFRESLGLDLRGLARVLWKLAEHAESVARVFNVEPEAGGSRPGVADWLRALDQEAEEERLVTAVMHIVEKLGDDPEVGRAVADLFLQDRVAPGEKTITVGGSGFDQLHERILQTFDPAELRVVVEKGFGARFSQDFSWDGRYAEVVFSVLNQVQRRGLMGRFLDALAVARPEEAGDIEQIRQTLGLRPAPPLEEGASGFFVESIEKGLELRDSIALISSPRGGLGTAWRIAPGLLMTSTEVVGPHEASIEGLTAHFARVRSGQGDPAALIGLPWSDPSIHVALIRFEEKGGAPLLIAPPREVPEMVQVLHHSLGRPLQLSLALPLKDFSEASFAYNHATGPGSSGAPVFDALWRVLGMHYGWRRVGDEGHAIATRAHHFLARLRHDAPTLWGEIAAAQPGLDT